VAITTVPGATSSDLTTLNGTELADTFAVEGKNQYIGGLAGADTITAATGVETITVDAGTGNDKLTFSGEANKVLANLDRGNDSLTLLDGLNSSINGGDGSDTVTQAVNRTFDGGQIVGRSGNDTFTLVNVKNAYIGGDQDDDSIVVSGTVTNSTIRGGNQRDTITLAKAGGVIKGDNNEDTITVTGTAKSLYVGGDGANDTINISSASVTGATVRGGAGSDDIDISSAALLVKGDKGNDDIDQATTNANHTIHGGSGKDSIDASSTSALLIYGDQVTENATTDGNDTITLTGIASSKGAHSIYGGAGKDVITTATGNADEYIDGGSGADTINAKAGQDTILGKAGADTINLSGTNAAGTYFSVRGGADNDVVTLDANAFASLSINDTIKGDLGTDTIAITGVGADFDMTVVGSVDASSFNNISTVETFALGTSTTALTMGGALSYKFSTAAQTAGIRKFDATKVTAVADRILTIDASTFTSTAGVTLSGSADGAVVSSLKGGSGNDTLNDGAISTAADETLTGGAGTDTFNITATTRGTQVTDLGLGASAEVLTVSSTAHSADVEVLGDFVATSATSNNKSRAGVVLTAAAGKDINMALATGNFGYTLDLAAATSASTLQGSSKADSITGGNLADSLIGNAGNDSIVAGTGNDIIAGGTGNDSITAGTGSDSVNAGTGNDTIVVTDNVALDSIDGGAGTDGIVIATGGGAVTNAFDFDLISNVLAITTTGANTSGVTFSAITTDTTVQTVALTSGSAALTVTNSAASATTTFNITGGAGADALVGSNGADTLSGAAGADTLTGGLGDDIINLGTDKSDYVFGLAATNGIDQITGFTSGADADDLDAGAAATFLNAGTPSTPLAVTATNVTGSANDNIIVLDVDDLPFANATALVSGTTTGIGSAVAGADATVIVLYGAASSADTRIAVATIANGGGVTAATDIGVIVGVKAQADQYNAGDFILN
jgi:Ca2+-binding RTX toxin-like protein